MLEQFWEVEEIPRPGCLREMLLHDDQLLRSCMITLATETDVDDGDAWRVKNCVARRLLLRLSELAGGVKPEWHVDTSRFSLETLRLLVDAMDARLHLPPTLDELARMVALSPSHFSRKFRQTTGHCVTRFVSLHRVQSALNILKSSGIPIAQLALDLGFCSQSHFNRTFVEFTGMTPAKYRKQLRTHVSFTGAMHADLESTPFSSL